MTTARVIAVTIRKSVLNIRDPISLLIGRCEVIE